MKDWELLGQRDSLLAPTGMSLILKAVARPYLELDERGSPALDHRVQPTHDSFLRPLLRCADVVWAYGLSRNPALADLVRDRMIPDRGRARLSLENDPVRGLEAFWNASGGQRGSILVLVDLEHFTANCFEGIDRWEMTDNPRSAHSAAAWRAAERSRRAGRIALLFPATNGLDWVDVVSTPADRLTLLARLEGFYQWPGAAL